ncbi:MAG: crotonase/enoyl-CoA hydratase family protein [Minwuia sp.]|nr:crotonase/enoyl-CoA hydratase family protein [Minwuia sp.]
MTDAILLQHDGPVATITINRPRARNALDPATAAELGRAIATVEADDAVSVVLLTGAGGRFCAGADLKQLASEGATYQAWAGADGPLSRPCMKPVIAAVEGHAVAGGLGVALWADLRVASETAVFGVFCRRFGVPMSDGTPTRLPRLIGQSRALDMMLTGREVRIDEALAMGLADRRAEAGQALKIARELALGIAQHPPRAMLADRASVFAAFDGVESECLVAEAGRAEVAKQTEAQAGASRFAEGIGRGGSFGGD